MVYFWNLFYCKVCASLDICVEKALFGSNGKFPMKYSALYCFPSFAEYSIFRRLYTHLTSLTQYNQFLDLAPTTASSLTKTALSLFAIPLTVHNTCQHLIDHEQEDRMYQNIWRIPKKPPVINC